MSKKILAATIILLISPLIITSCQFGWHIDVTSEGQQSGKITNESVAFFVEKSGEESNEIALGQMLYDHGFSLIDKIAFTMTDSKTISFKWDEIAKEAVISTKGDIKFDGETYRPASIDVAPTVLNPPIDISIVDIAPTMAQVLNLPKLPDAIGEAKYTGEAEYGVVIFMDGLQYQKFQELREAGKLPFFQNLGVIQRGLTIYPPITTSASAALLTGALPKDSNVYGYGYRSTDLTTLFDIAVENERSVIAVEGYALAFNLRNAETTLSGDRDKNGFTDDNVFENTLKTIQKNMPDLMYIHFHDIDDMGHTYGPESIEYESAIQRVDGYVNRIYEALPENTFLVLFADHGMHETQNGGNHGTLTATDLIIPIIFLEK